jgi:GGDEF domain-containing protein
MLNRRKIENSEALRPGFAGELAEITFNGVLLTISVGGIATTCIIAGFGFFRHNPWAYQLAAFVGTFAALRVLVALVYQFKCSGGRRQDLVSTIQWTYATATILYCLSYGVGTFLAFSHRLEPDGFLFTLGTFMLCGGLSGRFGLEPWVLQLAGFSMLIPLGLGVLYLPSTEAALGCLLVILYGLIYLQTTRSQFSLLMKQLRSQRQLRNLAERDPLTGLFNRRYLQSLLESVSQSQIPYAVLFLDLDRFKAVNDTFGHAVGDSLLQHVADRLLKTVRKEDVVGHLSGSSAPLAVNPSSEPADTVARFGGDEFAILITHKVSVEAAEALACRINQVIADLYVIDGHEIRIGTSIGVRVSISPTQNVEDAMRKADEALYRAKKVGGGVFRVETA